MQKLIDQADTAVAIPPSAGATGAVTANKVDGTGYGRARFIFSFGANSNTSAAISAGLGVWAASTSGATFAQVAGASLAAVTSGILSNVCMAIDVAISSGTPWLLISGGSMLSTAIANSCTVDLYRGVKRPDVDSYQQVVTV